MKVNARGQTITEFALLMPIMMVIFGAAVDFGLAFFVANVVQNAAREGARFAVTLPDLPQSDVAVTCPSGDSRICDVVGKKIPNISLFDGLTVTYQGPTDVPGDGTTQLMVNVTVSGVTYKYMFLPLVSAPLPLLGFSSFPTSVTISRSTTMRWESQIPL